MGLDKIYYTFYRLFGGNEDMEENNFNNNFNYIPCEVMFIDGNFILYQIIHRIECDLNEILKIILAISHNTNRNILLENLENKLTTSPLKKFINYFEEIFYLDNLDDMIKMLRSKTLDINDKDNKLDEIICEYYIEYLENNILKLHKKELLKELYLIFDGIPSGFKIIEQRRRRLKNFLESNLRKRLIGDKMINFPEDLSLNLIGENKYIYDYGKFVENMITLPKSFGPSSKVFKMVGLNVRNYLKDNYKKVVFWYSGVNENGEADFKIIHLCRLTRLNNIVIHCSDFDFIILGSRIQNELNKKVYLIRHFNNNYLIINFLKLNERILSYISNKYEIEKQKRLIDDFYFSMIFFGNDYIPPLNELTFDSNFTNLIDIIGNNLWKNNKYLLNHDKLNILNLKVLFINLNNLSSISLKNILKSNFFCNDLIKNLPENINNLIDLTNLILEPYWYKKILELKNWNEIFKKDLRMDYIQKYIPKLREEIVNMRIEEIIIELNKNQNFKNILNNSKLSEKLIDILDKNLKPYYIKNNGLKEKESSFNFTENSYDNLYYYFYNKSKKKIITEFSNLENRVPLENNLLNYDINKNINEQIILNDYILSIRFINYKFYNPMKLSYYFYPHYISPCIDWFNKYLNENNENLNKYIEENNFIDSRLHLLIISPNYENLEEYFPELIFINENFNLLENNIINKKFNNYRDINLKELKIKYDKYIKNIINKNNVEHVFDTSLVSFSQK